MKIDDFYAACRAIHAELAAIAELTKNMAGANCADPSNPDWISLMDRQDEMLRHLMELARQPIEP